MSTLFAKIALKNYDKKKNKEILFLIFTQAAASSKKFQIICPNATNEAE